MKFKRWLALIASSALVITVLAGCGGGGGSITSTPLLEVLVNELEQTANITVEDNDIEFNTAFSDAINRATGDTSDPNAVVNLALDALSKKYGTTTSDFSDQLTALGSTGSKALDVKYVRAADSSAANEAAREWRDALDLHPLAAGSYLCCVSVIKKGDYYFLSICVTVSVPDDPVGPAPDDEPDYDSYIHIQTVQELIDVANRVNAGETDLKIKLDNTIDLQGRVFTPIGSSRNSFTGIFDGGGYAIQGLKVNITSGTINNGGLFGEITEGGIVENLTLENPEIRVQASSYPYAGCIAGSNYGGTIKNCTVSGGSVWAEAGSVAYAGGIAGGNTGPYGKEVGIIINCTVSGVEIKGTSKDLTIHVGGIVGMNEKSITGCKVVGSGIKAEDDCGQLNAGGIVGTNVGGSVKECDVSASFITAKELNGTHNTTEGNAGGIVGYNNGAGIIANCDVVNSQITSDGVLHSNSGGIVGTISLTGSSITGSSVSQNCYIEAWTSKDSCAGGIVGRANSMFGGIAGSNVSGGTIKAVAAAQGNASANALVGDHPECGNGYNGCTVEGNPAIIA